MPAGSWRNIAIPLTDRILNAPSPQLSWTGGTMCVPSPRTLSLCSSDAERGTFIAGWIYKPMHEGLTEERTSTKYACDGRNIIRIARHNFAERFERGKLSSTGDVLQVISVFGRHQKSSKLLKQITVGA